MARPPDTARESEIYEVATRVFRDKGYHGTSMRDIADELGIQKPSLYHYISSKQDLLFRIFEQGTGALTDQLDEIVRSDASATVKLERAVESHLTALCDQLEFFTVYLREQKFFSGKQMQQVRLEAQRHADLLEKIVNQGIAAGEFRHVDAKVTALAIIGMCNWLFQWYSPQGRLRPDEIANIFSGLMLDGLHTPPKRPRTTKARKQKE